ncbi:MAG: MFS transporter [Propionibacteriaceae bacterium]|uniref:Uncharacterized protein n=1 Tax=Propionibacterium ruminifibrarum TaxID=1962131 RepID=A0A375I1E7_9ACTN|nr:MFS transporter [Propionibacterium ruminifibrarum]MBE6477647.1 MFS transporter [Propionibacteriaceae bacterium]SPF68477.1 hypothetical protein PROPJV5_1456 [Propionibacterium ruminifibrarum]
MGVTGLIWLAIVAGWLAYLVPRFVLHKDPRLTVRDARMSDFTESMRVVRHSKGTVKPDFSELNDPALQISTPLQREAVMFEVRRAAQTAERRRRLGLVGSLVLMIASVVIAVVTSAPWWLSLIGVALLGVFVVVSRISVRTVDAMIDAKLDSVYQDQDWSEDTVAVNTVDLTDVHDEDTEISISLELPMASSIGSLWEPIAVTPPTYVSKPLVPRSVRTIDLSAPVPPVAAPQVPVVAEPPQGEGRGDEEQDDRPRAVGE